MSKTRYEWFAKPYSVGFPPTIFYALNLGALSDTGGEATDEIDNKLNELQNELLRLANSKTDYNHVADEIYRLRELKQNTLARNAEREGKRQCIAEMTRFLKKQPKELQVYDEQLVRRLIKKITVFDNKLTIEFKFGLEIKTIL